MKVYLTKYALSKGISIQEAVKTECGKYWAIQAHHNLYLEDECFESRKEALKNAEERRIKKLQSLDKQTKKISALNFDV